VFVQRRYVGHLCEACLVDRAVLPCRDRSDHISRLSGLCGNGYVLLDARVGLVLKVVAHPTKQAKKIPLWRNERDARLPTGDSIRYLPVSNSMSGQL
jgi:hypothetical protein